MYIMSEQLRMIWPENRIGDPPQWRVPEGYMLRGFHPGDEEQYIELMHLAGFDTWCNDNLDAVFKYAVPDGIFFAEHIATSKLAATAMGWCPPTPIYADAHEMGWVAADPSHRGKGLGHIVVAAATRALLVNGAKSICLLTDDWRLPAISIYLKLGYMPVYHAPDMETRWEEVRHRLGMDAKPEQ